jgi:hypothetical protein
MDAGRLESKERADLRETALAWLATGLAFWTKQAAHDDPEARQLVLQTLKRWQKDRSLACVRDQDGLLKLSEMERQPWRKLWDNVDDLLAKVAPR